MYSRDQIQQVRSALDIVEVIRDYVPSLKAAGRSIRGLCPFHQEKTPSFHVHQEKGFYKCFGCGESGDVIHFFSQIEQIGFSEAIEKLAGRVGIALKKEVSSAKREEESVKEKLYRLLEVALSFYEEQLQSDRVGLPARSYLKERGIKEETVHQFRLGYAPPTGFSCFEFLVKKGFSIDLCHKAGVVSRSQTGRYYDPLYGRLIFPIFDHFGHGVGFGGRILPSTKKPLLGEEADTDTGAPKYINSPDTPLFSKGRLLYGLLQAKSHVMADRRVLILEGYMDVIGAHQGGFPLAVATLGTALTRDHAKMIKRYADEVVAFFDPDEAGQRAALRGLEPLLQESLFPRLVQSEEALDPDEVILQKGKEAFHGLIENASDFVEHLLRMGMKKGSLSLQEKSKLAQQILQIVSHSSNEVLKSEWTHRVAQALTLDPSALESERKKVRGLAPKETVPGGPGKKREIRLRLPTAEEECLQLLMNVPEAWNDLSLDAVDFKEERLRVVFGLLEKQMANKGKVEPPAIYDALPVEEKEWFLQLSTEEIDFEDPLQRRDQLIRDIRIMQEKKKLAVLSAQVARGEASSQQREEYRYLLRQIKGSPRTVVTKN
ncbi:DNA primase [bacterium F11]|nr:DNA primase [bacterium F11]